MYSPKNSERRKARDAALRTQDETIAEHLEQARVSGELQSARNFGRPMFDPEGWDETPAELRLAFKILKNAGVAPPEIELFHRRAALRDQIAACGSDSEREALRKRLSELEQLIALRLESLRSSGKL
jgi:hypothetical protein